MGERRVFCEEERVSGTLRVEDALGAYDQKWLKSPREVSEGLVSSEAHGEVPVRVFPHLLHDFFLVSL